MMSSGAARLLCLTLSLLLAAPGFAQTPAPPSAQTPAPPSLATPQLPGSLKIVILEGNKAINSIPLLRSVAPVVEIEDQNDFPVEGASVVFTLPQGGTFAIGGATFSTLSDARGQAAGPAVVPKTPGNFGITVTATAGNRRGEAIITQTNSTGTVTGLPLPKQPWYKRKLIWAIAGGALVGVVLAIVLTEKSKPVAITPGAPVFQ